ncbi:hypothetical protein NDU88_000587 [Pleurodeles waltl]|uniref:Uncharacterized protein n=1 Tax=Pleurodeles waltl TaxID=8319 RepID=A0AAV7LWY3_PLEWA|nr:hypothetical protein NDU88_000587 [Pleurodeles waltl]
MVVTPPTTKNTRLRALNQGRKVYAGRRAPRIFAYLKRKFPVASRSGARLQAQARPPQQLERKAAGEQPPPGTRNPADFLSRHARTATPQEAEEAQETEEYVRMAVERARPLPIPLGEVVTATAQDECLQLAIAATRTGNWRALQRPTPSEHKKLKPDCMHCSIYGKNSP